MPLRLHRLFGLHAAVILVACLGGAPAFAFAQTESPAPTTSAPYATPLQLFAAVERAWNAADANVLASLCDSAVVRVALKPGSPPATAPTLGAVAFLIQDQLRLVVSRRFHVVRFEVDQKKRTARAWARWVGEWGGARNTRDVQVNLQARAAADGGWLLTEIRANN